MTDQLGLDVGDTPAASPTPDQVTISARVSARLRDQVTAATRPNENQSDTVRRLVSLGLDAERQAHEAMAAGGVARNNDPPTARRAAWESTPRAGSQRAIALQHFQNAGAKGLTADDVCALMPQAAVNGLARRVTDLLQGGLIEPAIYVQGAEHGRTYILAGLWGARGALKTEGPSLDDVSSSTATRLTRHKSRANIYVITQAGLQVLTDINRKENPR